MASGDTALWLHNKLGSTDDLWSGKTICSHLSREKLLSIHTCFYTLQPHVKVKVMLSFLHLPRRNVEEWQKEMEEILAMAAEDSDHWVATVAEILQTFPETGALKLDLENNSAFAEILADLKKVVRKNVDNRMLPIECQFLNKKALLTVAGQLPQPVKHFALKRKPKSATLRAELLQKSTEVANNRKNNVNNAGPAKVRSFSKKLDDPTFVKTPQANNRSPSSVNPLTIAGTPSTPSILTSTTASTSNCFLSASAGLSRSSSLTPRATTSTASLRGKEGGIKLIEIAEQPVGAKEAKRRKKMADQEASGQQKKEKETVTAATSTVETTTSYTPDYAVGLVTPALAKLPTPVGVTSTNSLSTTTPTYVPATNTRIPVGATILSVTSAPSSTNPKVTRENLQLQLQHQLGQSQPSAAAAAGGGATGTAVTLTPTTALQTATLLTPANLVTPTQQQQQQTLVIQAHPVSATSSSSSSSSSGGGLVTASQILGTVSAHTTSATGGRGATPVTVMTTTTAAGAPGSALGPGATLAKVVSIPVLAQKPAAAAASVGSTTTAAAATAASTISTTATAAAAAAATLKAVTAAATTTVAAVPSAPASQAPTPTATQVSVSTSTETSNNSQQPKKLQLRVNKKNLSEIREIFDDSNTVSRPEKALIFAFMRGSRVNPCPEQGDVISIRLGEKEEIRKQAEGTKKVTVETFFQMNYVTGEWKRVSKTH